MLNPMNRRAVIALVGFLLLAAASCSPNREKPVKESNPAQRPPIAEVLARHTPSLMAIDGVVGTYQGALPDGAPAIKILLLDDHPEARAKIPEELEGYPVVIEGTDEIRPMGKDSTGS